MTMRQNTRQQECNISLDHDEDKNCVDSVLPDEVVEELQMHENVDRQLSVVNSQLTEVQSD
jgi:hypothetical protein